MSTNPFSNQPDRLQNISATPERVGFGPRLAAFVIDALTSILLAVLVTAILHNYGVGQTPELEKVLSTVEDIYALLGIPTYVLDSAKDWIAAWMLGTVIASVAYSLIEGLSNASPGKRVMRLYIASADGARCNTGTLLARWAVKNIGSITTFLALAPSIGFIETVGSMLSFVVFIGCFFVLSEKRQALHDIIAQTAVYHH